MDSYKKIAVLCNYQLLPERVGGMDYFFWLFDQQCKKKGIQVDWFFPNQAEHGQYADLTIHNCSYKSIENYFLHFCKENSTSYTHIYTHFIELCTPFFKKIKCFSNAEILVVDHNPRPLKGYPLKKRVIKRIKGFLFSRYIDLFVGVSKYSVSEMIKEFGPQLSNKSIVIFNGLDSSKFKRKKKFVSSNRFIVVSHLRIDKGIQDLILAVKMLNEQFVFDFVIDIYGEGYYEKNLMTMIKSYALENFFNFKGSVANLNEIYCDYDYLIHPSHGETFGYAILESLMCHLPVITTKNQGNVLGLIIDNQNGFLFQEENVVELKIIVKNILTNKAVIYEKALDSTFENYSLEKMVENHLSLLMLNSKKG